MKKRRFLNKCTINMLLALVITTLFSFSVYAVDYPKPTELKYVNDYTSSTLDQSTKEYIVSVGKELEDKTGAQEVIVVVDSLQEIDIETYANELFRTWGIGQKDKDNGFLILLSMKEREWRVEVGTGLEGAVPDIYSSRVMEAVAVPKFKEGNYSQGLKDSYSAFADAIAKEYNVTLEKNEKITLPAKESSVENNFDKVMGSIVLLLIILDLALNRGRIISFILASIFFRGGRGGGNGGFGGGFGGGSSGGGFGGFGGGSSSGGGSSGKF